MLKNPDITPTGRKIGRRKCRSSPTKNRISPKTKRMSTRKASIITVHVEPASPNLFAIGVVRLRWRAQLVGSDAAHLAVEQQCHRHKALLLNDPSPAVKPVVLPAVVPPLPAGVPLVQRHTAVSYPMGVIHRRACRDDAPRHKNYQSTLMGEKLTPLTRAFFNAFLTLSEIAILVGKKNASEEPTIGTIEYFFIFSVESTALINMLLFTP